jgi:hypothetical protein
MFYLINTLLIFSIQCNTNMNLGYLSDTFVLCDSQENHCELTIKTFDQNKRTHVITISDIYFIYNEIMTIKIIEDTCISVKYQKLKYEFPLHIQEPNNQLISETFEEHNFFIKNNLIKFCELISNEDSDIGLNICAYLDLLSEEDREKFIKHFQQ